MGKKRSCFCFARRLFVPEAKSKEDKRSVGRRRWLCGRIKIKHHPTILDEEASPQRKTLNDAKEEQRKHAWAVAIATATAAEAAVAAANAAAEVVRLTRFPKTNQNSAAIKIQSVYRAHLARKALIALKGVVRLQAVIRGQILRHQITNQLKGLQYSVAKTHSRVHQIRLPSFDEVGEDKQFFSLRKDLDMEQVKLECSSGKNWEYTLFPKQDKEVIWLQKQEASTKRAHMKKYSFSHLERNDQILEEFITVKKNSAMHQKLIDNGKRRNAQKEHSGELNSPSYKYLPRRSYCRAKGQEYSTGSDDTSLPNSPAFPSYMATTESAKAKARSMSTPRHRLPFVDMYSVTSSSYKPKTSSWSSYNGELTGN